MYINSFMQKPFAQGKYNNVENPPNNQQFYAKAICTGETNNLEKKNKMSSFMQKQFAQGKK